MKATRTVCLLCLLALCLQPVWSAELTAPDVEKLVKDSGLLPPMYSVCTAAVNGHQVSIRLNKPPKDLERECRINSVLLAKALMEKDPDVDVVVVWFRVSPEKWWIFEPTRATVSYYAQGSIDEERLLRNLPLNVHVEARSLDDVIRSSVGPGPYPDERAELLNWYKRHSGRVPDSPYPPLPTIDSYLPRFIAIEQEARSKSSKSADRDLLTRIFQLKKDLNTAAQAFSNLPEAERNRQIVAYLRKNRISLDTWGRKTPGRTITTSAPAAATLAPRIGSAGARALTSAQQQFVQLSSKYPEYTPSSTVPLELGRRQQAGLRLMQLAEAKGMRKEFTDSFQSVESAARSNDNASLQARLRYLERALGLPSLPITSQ
jgi:hypothetical protein